MSIEDITPPPPPPPASLLPPPPPPPPSEEEPLGPTLKPKKKGWGTVSKKQPPSIDDILKAKRAQEEAASKPKFLTKAQREKIALEKLHKEAKEGRKLTQVAPEKGFVNGTTTNGRPPAHDATSIPTGPRAMRSEAPTGPASMRARGDMPPPPVPKPGERRPGKRSAHEDDEAAEAALIRQRYMGSEQNQSTFSAKKKRRRTPQNQFLFEWNEEEDTYSKLDANYVYRDILHEAPSDRDADQKRQKLREYMIAQDPETGAQRFRELEDRNRKLEEKIARKSNPVHWKQKSLEEMEQRDWRIFKENYEITTQGGSLPNPMRYWEESPLPREILDLIQAVGYDEPSAIQRAAIPIALQSRDLIGVAVTGSGKTASFILPLLVYIQQLPPLNAHNRNDGPYALIMAPTRELAQQIESEVRKFAGPLGYKTAAIIGGHSIEEQLFEMRDGCEIVIATPGRLKDCLERRILVLSQCHYVIMDEADRMIDMNFGPELDMILESLPVSNEKPDTDAAEDSALMSRGLYRQTMMYTATMPPDLERIARKYLRRPAIVTIGNAGEAVESVEQRVEQIQGEDRRKRRLEEILLSGDFPAPIIVFVNIKRNCDTIAQDIRRFGFKAVTLHGSKTQEQRELGLAQLRNGQADVLVATDLAGRGIDVPDVSLVVNFNMANNIQSYTHRIGRTGRAGKTGVAITFWGNEDVDVLYDLKQILSKSAISKVPEDLRKHEAAQQKGGRKGKEGKALF